MTGIHVIGKPLPCFLFSRFPSLSDPVFQQCSSFHTTSVETPTLYLAAKVMDIRVLPTPLSCLCDGSSKDKDPSSNISVTRKQRSHASEGTPFLCLHLERIKETRRFVSSFRTRSGGTQLGRFLPYIQTDVDHLPKRQELVALHG